MDKEKKKQLQIKESRKELVVQSNDLIRNVRALKADLSVQEQHLIVYIISKLCAEDKDFKKIKFNIAEYCDVCGIVKSGREYERIKKGIKNLRDKSYWIKEYNGDDVLFSWIDTARIRKNKSVELILSEALKPYLLELTKNFTAYELINILCLKSKYSIRLYELLKSYLWLNKWEVSLDDFREMMYIQDKYPLYKELKRNVIESSIKEINKYTDLQVDVIPIKKGKSIDKLKFLIEEKRGVQMTMDLLLNQEERMSILESKK